MGVSDVKRVSSRVPELDSLYVYHTRHEVKEVVKRLQPSVYRYTVNGVVLQDDGIYTYHKTLVLDGVRKGITIVTKEHRITKIKDFFKAVEKDIPLASFKTATATPHNLNIKYLAK